VNYVTGVVMQFTTQGSSEVIIKARGKFIAKAVDIEEVASKRFLDNQIEITDVKLDSEEFKNKEGKQVRVSTIEIYLKKK
jgi:archaea-specific DNA-binding protein